MPNHEYFMGFARHAASASKDTTKVGAALVDRDGTVLLTGYNGPPRGVRDIPERFVRPTKYLFASHAEQNLIAFAARKGIATNDCRIYVTHHPCPSCMKSIIQAGITCVYIDDGVTVMEIEPESAIMADEAGVKLERI